MIVMSELLRDSTYLKFLSTKPYMPPHLKDPQIMATPPWVVYVQGKADGPWGRKSFWKYGKALKFMNRALSLGVYDVALNNKRIGYDPPNRLARIKGKYVKGSDGKVRQATKLVPWKPPSILLLDQPEHHWCVFCRRPTIFKYYSKHRMLGKVTQDVTRCCICGASARIALATGDRMYSR